MAATLEADTRLINLQKANAVRSWRASLKRDLRERPQLAPRLILDPPDYLASMQVRRFLKALPGFGRVKVDRVMRATMISAGASIGGLTDRQRFELARRIYMWELS